MRALVPDACGGGLRSQARYQSTGATRTGVAGILERSRENGPMRDAPLAFVVALASALAEATIDFIIHDPDHAEAHGRTGFDAFWRMIT